ncbi:MAG: iron-containing alcohol dehydrogenase [Rhodospirillaceae bacterium]|nr:iron-containing alcohol dehydrogenase [Rhodospirillaceae bacterium]
MAHIPSFPGVHFGFEAINELPGELKDRGVDRPLVITDQGLVEHGVCQQLLDALPADIKVSVFDNIPENPTIAGVEGALAVYQENNCNGIIGLGGGSVLDSGKALRVATNLDLSVIEILNDLSKVTADVAPYITIPTTAGTGAEITFGGGIHPETNAPAMTIRSIHVQPDLAICDPDFTMTLPPRLTAATGMDALTHCVEGFLSKNANPPAEAIALDGTRRVIDYIHRAVDDGSDREARLNMSMAALQGGMAIYMGLGPIHALSMCFGDSPLHHGTLVTVAMPAVMRFFNGKLADSVLERYAEAMNLAGDKDAGNRIADAVAEMNAKLGLPATVREMGYEKTDVDRMIEEAHDSPFNLPSPIRPSMADYGKLVTEVLG